MLGNNWILEDNGNAKKKFHASNNWNFVGSSWTNQKGEAKEKKDNHKTSETKSDIAIKAKGMISFIKRQRFSG